MRVSKLIESDYSNILCKWWKDWRWLAAPSKDALPDDGTGGLIVYDGDTPVCAGFLYISNSKVCHISWIISNFNYKDRLKRKEALTLLIDSLSVIGFELGYKYCYINFNTEHLVNVCEDLGFSKNSVSKEMIKVWGKRQE